MPPSRTKIPLAFFPWRCRRTTGHPYALFPGNRGRDTAPDRLSHRERLAKAHHCGGESSEAPIYIDDTAALSALELRAKARRLKSEYGLGMVIVDYLQLMKGRSRVESRQQEISEISRSLKALAKELNIPVIAVSQLSRKTEERTGNRPQLSDLRESGAIEQDADLILFIYRDEVYNRAEDNPNRGKAEVIIGKQRNGPIGKIDLAFLDKFTTFKDLYRGETENNYQ